MKIGSDTFILGFSGTELAFFFGQKLCQIHIRIEKMNLCEEKKLRDKTAITYDSPLWDAAPMSTVSSYLGKRIVRCLHRDWSHLLHSGHRRSNSTAIRRAS